MSHRLVVLLAALGCGSSPPHSTPDAPRPPATTVSVAVWPQHWQAVVALPQLKLLEVTPPASFWDVVHAGAREIGLAALALPPPGIDPSAPITFEVEPPSATFEVYARFGGTHELTPEARDPRLARITIPATDPAALAAAIEQASAKAHSGVVVRVVRGAKAVALDLYRRDAAPAAPPPPAIVLPFETGAPSAVRVAIHLRGLDDVMATTSIVRIFGALAEVEPRDLDPILAAGLAEMLTGYLMLDPATAVSAGAFLDVPATGEPEIGFALTDGGRAALAAGGLAPGARAAIGAVHWADAAKAAPHPAVLGKDLADVARAFHECGAACFLYVAIGNALAIVIPGSADNLAGIVGPTLERAGLATRDVVRTGSDLVFITPTGAAPPQWTGLDASAPATDTARACYHKALFDVRTALKADTRGAARWTAADAALATSDACVAHDPALAARDRALHEAFTGLARRAPP